MVGMGRTTNANRGEKKKMVVEDFSNYLEVLSLYIPPNHQNHLF
jgi:hypothetical protein